jgi:DNA-binding NtrC family response regulator
MTNRLKTLLIVDDDEGMRDTLTAILRRDYRALAVASAEAAVPVLKSEPVDLMLLDVRLPGMNGIDMLRLVKEQYPMVEVIVISAVSEVETAVQAMKLGAYHYITKDFEYDALRSLVRNASVKQDLSRQVAALSAQVAEQEERPFVEGPSAATRAVLELVHKVARLSSTVLFLGESGTGKELLARMIHRESAQRDGPFIAVNLAAIPHELVESALFGHEKGAFTGAVRQQLGKFELAAGGTLFLDEIGELRPDLQIKLLRAIQEAEIERVGGTKPLRTDFRLICATNVDLDRAVRDGRFREDLYYRINVVPVRVPPLRERLDDLPVLTEFFVARYATRFRKNARGLTAQAVAVLQNHHWPGNVRELENLVERLIAVTDQPWIEVEDLPLEYRFATIEAEPRGGSLIEHALDAFERSFILRSLEKTQGNVTAAARHLGIPLSTLKHKMSRLDISAIARRFRAVDDH